VATSPEELVQLEALYARGLHNGVELRMVTAAEAHAIEPRARVFERAIHSPTTASVDPGAVMARLASCAVAEGVEVRCGEGFARLAGEAIHSTREAYSAGTFINAAGLHADAIAHAFGLGLRYRILPFRGRYLRSGEPPGRLHVHVYPVPDPQWPFLGVHCTVTVDGAMKLGPTAFPALWREQYGGLANFRLGEFAQVCKREIQLLVRSRFRFATLAWRELATASAAGMVAQATRLVDGLDPAGSWTPTRPGIRAQLIDLDTGRLENDFVIESDTRSVHVLNAVSPAFTCAFPFAEHVCDRIEHGPAAG
jgi:L-2-hydroxyglutarate oxidase LhgO